jgi:hypothetical protein
MPTQAETRINNVWARLFRYGFDELRRAYEAAREASDSDRKRQERQWEELEREVAAGRASFIEEDEEGRVAYDRGEHAGEMIAEIEGILRIVREAFTISLHHFWEREITKKMRSTKYQESEAFAFLKSKQIESNEIALKTLRLAANVAKHSEGTSAKKLHKLRPELFDSTEMAKFDDPPGYEYLRITDQILDEFFEAVRISGPQPLPWRSP